MGVGGTDHSGEAHPTDIAQGVGQVFCEVGSGAQGTAHVGHADVETCRPCDSDTGHSATRDQACVVQANDAEM
jgi:hypothetical protein